MPFLTLGATAELDHEVTRSGYQLFIGIQQITLLGPALGEPTFPIHPTTHEERND
jgi:hypothetical protein